MVMARTQKQNTCKRFYEADGIIEAKRLPESIVRVLPVRVLLLLLLLPLPPPPPPIWQVGDLSEMPRLPRIVLVVPRKKRTLPWDQGGNLLCRRRAPIVPGGKKLEVGYTDERTPQNSRVVSSFCRRTSGTNRFLR